MVLVLVAFAVSATVTEHAFAKPRPESTEPLEGDPDNDYGPASGPIKSGGAKSSAVGLRAGTSTSSMHAVTGITVTWQYISYLSMRAFWGFRR